MFVAHYATGDRPRLEVSSEVQITEINGESVALVAYERTGTRGWYQRMFKDMFQNRVAAITLEGGEVLWDEQLNGELISDTRVIVAGKGHVYVASNDGLYIRSLEDGSSVAEPDSITGLENYVADADSYEYDRDLEVIVAIDETGDLKTIPLGEASAEPASDEVNERWSILLTGSSILNFADQDTVMTAQLAPGMTLSVKETAPGAQTSSLVLDGGEEVPFGDETFYNPRIITNSLRVMTPLTLDDIDTLCFFDDLYCEFDVEELEYATLVESGKIPEMPATSEFAGGMAYGVLFIHSNQSANSYASEVVAIELSTGLVIDRLEMAEFSTVGGAVAGECYVLIPITSSDEAGIIVFNEDGTMSLLEIADLNFFGNHSG